MILIAVFSMAMLQCGKQQNQEAPKAQVSASVAPRAALEAMHEVIHPMWHDAYPARDVEQLKGLYPELQEKFALFQKVQFPDSLRDKSMHWKEGVAKLEQALKAYGEAVQKNDSTAILEAARELHSRFETLVKILNPPIPALDEFHKVLFKVFHDYLPNNDWGKINQTIPEFVEKARALKSATLPKRMADRQQEFEAARQELLAAVDELSKLKEADNRTRVKEALDNVHEAFKKLEEVLE